MLYLFFFTPMFSIEPEYHPSHLGEIRGVFMCFSDISVYQIPSHFRPKYTNLHQSYTNLAKLHLFQLKSHI